MAQWHRQANKGGGRAGTGRQSLTPARRQGRHSRPAASGPRRRRVTGGSVPRHGCSQSSVGLHWSTKGSRAGYGRNRSSGGPGIVIRRGIQPPTFTAPCVPHRAAPALRTADKRTHRSAEQRPYAFRRSQSELITSMAARDRGLRVAPSPFERRTPAAPVRCADVVTDSDCPSSFTALGPFEEQTSPNRRQSKLLQSGAELFK